MNEITEEIDIKLTELDFYQKKQKKNPNDKQTENIPEVKKEIEKLNEEKKKMEQEISSLTKKSNELLKIGFPELIKYKEDIPIEVRILINNLK